jgi:tRNA 5-methylaminomethyl-2-thiouridine biosynthesis bifunctional protein
MMAQATQLLREGEDWAPSGVLEQRSTPLEPLWHAQAAWIKPANLVQAWLKHPAIRFHGNTRVHALQQAAAVWALQSADGQRLASATHVVFANAFGCQAILSGVGIDVSLQKVHGTLSHGPQSQLEADVCPVAPVNGNGSFVHSIPGTHGLQWYAGASFETDPGCIADTPSQHIANYQRLRDLLPSVAETLSGAFEKNEVAAWTGTRCVTRDRMPMVGPLHQEAANTLWISAGMGSRGLTFSALCAELLAAQMCAEPLPVEFSLVRSLHVNRIGRKRISRSDLLQQLA